MIEQLSAPVIERSENVNQHEVDARFENIILLFDLNSALAGGDLQADHVAQLRQKRDELLGELMTNPAEAFEHEFDLLERLYEGRTVTSIDSTGSTRSQFVTRDSKRQRADLHFTELNFPSGSTVRTVEVPGAQDSGSPFFISLIDGEMHVTCTVYERGASDYRVVDPESDKGRQLLQRFFTHSIVASDLVYGRTPDQIEEADVQARRFLYAKIAAQREL